MRASFFVAKMPLLKGKNNIGKNIETEMAHGKKHDQAVAIAMSVAGMAKKKKDKKSMTRGQKMMMRQQEMEKMRKKLGTMYG